MGTLIVSVVLVIALVSIVYKLVSNKKKNPACCSGCSGCGLTDSCGKSL